jgi:hypothetical protein
MAVKDTLEISINKLGPNGRPVAIVRTSPDVSLDRVLEAVQGKVTRNVDLLKKLGLKACPACISGFDLDFRHRFDDVLRVDF